MSYSLSLDRFAGKVAVVTGASSGIGKAIVEGLVKYGVTVAGLARRVERIEAHAKELAGAKGRLQPYKTDLTKKDEIISTFDKIKNDLGPTHILVNNAGLLLASNIIDGDIEKWEIVLNTNVLAVSICIREAVASMKANNIKGHIININSVAGHDVLDIPGLSVYPASKFALRALTESVRLEINREKLPIKITSISPGAVDTEFNQAAFPAEQLKKLAHVNSSQKLISTEDVADSAFYVLATPEHVNVKELIIVPHGAIY
ncbi:hypothetical protein HUJ04_003369 [Dendroctonus ponderosae]|nr:hypothetical protein HUJ04_003369 [Dendroctonus ponderosae]